MSLGNKKHVRVDTVSEEEALNLGVGKHEWDLINKGLGALPNRAQFLVFLLCWSEEISRKSYKIFFKDLKQISIEPFSEDSGSISLDSTRELVAVSGEKNFLSNISFKLASESLINSLLSRLLELNAKPEFLNASINLGPFDKLFNQQALKKSITSFSENLNNISLPFFPFKYRFSKEFDKVSVLNGLISGVRNVSTEKKTVEKEKQNDIIFYIGLPTKKEGLNHFGATELHQQVPRVDFFYLNCISRAIYSAFDKNLITGLISLEDSPFASSLIRLSQKLSSGIEFDLSKVPGSEEMHFLDVLLSQSHHRFIGATSKKNHRALSDHFLEHGIDFQTVGRVRESDDLEIIWENKILANLPYSFILKSTPIRQYPLIEDPPMLKESLSEDSGEEESINSKVANNYKNFSDLWLDMLACPNLTSREVPDKHFDSQIGARGISFKKTGLDLVFLSDNDEEVFSVSTSSLPAYSNKDAYLAASHSFAECCREISSLGLDLFSACATFNGGNLASFKDVADFSEMLNGAIDVSREWEIPCLTSATSSFNGTRNKSIPATPTLSILGKQESKKEIILKESFENGDKVLLIGKTFNEPGSSQYLRYINGVEGEGIPTIDIANEKKLCKVVSNLKKSGFIKFAMSVSSGGYVLAISKFLIEQQAEKSLGLDIIFSLTHEQLNSRGFNIEAFREDFFLLSECPGRFILAVKEDEIDRVKSEFSKQEIEIEAEGVISGKDIKVSGLPSNDISLGIKTIKKVWNSGLSVIETSV